MNTYIVEGGVGKCLAFSSLVDSLAERDGSPIQVYTPYHEVFGGNPNVKMVFDAQTIPMQHPAILESSNIFYCEPYKANFMKGGQHIIESYCELLGLEYKDTMRPKMYSDHLEKELAPALDKAGIKRRYVVVQFAGGQPYIGYKEGNQYINADMGRNYHPWLAQQVVNKLLEEDADRDVVQFGLPNEPVMQGAKTIPSNLAGWHEIVKGSEGFIGIDSSLNHIAASAGVKGVVIWGSTRFNQFGYPENKNLNTLCEDKWVEEGFNSFDPRNSMVDPDKVIRLYKEIV